MSNIRETLGKNLKKIRQRHGESSGDFAKRLGLSVQAYSELERGKSFTTADRLDQFCKTLGVAPSDLFAGDGEELTKENVMKFLKERIVGDDEVIRMRFAGISKGVQELLEEYHKAKGNPWLLETQLKAAVKTAKRLSPKKKKATKKKK